MQLKESIISFLKELREEIIAHFENFEAKERFKRTPWPHKTGGGGEMAVLRGEVFEKAAVNFSAVFGDTFPMSDGEGPYFATGLSLITHMANPHVPTVHLNIRYIETKKKNWFAGGYDLTPMGLTYEEDVKHFHKIAKDTLDPFDFKLYPEFSKNAENYFYIPHRGKQRGVGGIFFDQFNTGDVLSDFNLWKQIGRGFLPAILPIYKRRIPLPFTAEDRQKQLECRAHYVEFNLLYDRGTKFGFLSGGNPDAILCSLPPLVKW
ncbi:MAG: oxygen-dependent coproporphyrinogen oxidase [Anaerolineae bacterium]